MASHMQSIKRRIKSVESTKENHKGYATCSNFKVKKNKKSIR